MEELNNQLNTILAELRYFSSLSPIDQELYKDELIKLKENQAYVTAQLEMHSDRLREYFNDAVELMDDDVPATDEEIEYALRYAREVYGVDLCTMDEPELCCDEPEVTEYRYAFPNGIPVVNDIVEEFNIIEKQTQDDENNSN